MDVDRDNSTRCAMRCRYCQKGFSKGEHLRRHERSHTGIKPYQCKECKRSFSRQDSLARHEKLHQRRRHDTRNDDDPDNIPHKLPTPESIRSADLNDVFAPTFTDGVSQPPTEVAELDFDLIWPDSEDLLQSLLSNDGVVNQWQQTQVPLPVFTSPVTTDVGAFDTSGLFDERPASIGNIPCGGNHQAVQDVSKMVSNLSSSVTAAARSTSITSVFLDECLHMFFVKFIPTFPVLHRATFVFRDCAHPLLLNAIAIGSLYLGPRDALAKGEALWHLAHTATATSWPSLITQRGPYDGCEGVQLVLTGVLSQVYGALSKNRTIRSTSHAFHSLGFNWARRCGMFDTPPFSPGDVPALDAPESHKQDQWRRWVAREIQQRTLLAGYMLDGLISQMSGEPTSVRHATNSLVLPSHEAAFQASTADEWILEMHSHSQTPTTFRSILKRLFLPEGFPHPLSAFSYKVVLEGLQSLISDDFSEEGTAVGVPSRGEVRQALARLYENIRSNTSLTSAELLEVLLRWHSICLDSSVDSSQLCRVLCQKYDIAQHIWRKQTLADVDLDHWVTTPPARAAVLHAVAIQEMVEQLPRGRAHTIHMPSSLFAAAVVLAVFSLQGRPLVKIPSSVVWPDVLLGNHSSDTVRYVHGDPIDGGNVTSRNLLYELNSMHKLFRCLLAQWGVAHDMESVIEQWIGLCH